MKIKIFSQNKRFLNFVSFIFNIFLILNLVTFSLKKSLDFAYFLFIKNVLNNYEYDMASHNPN